MFKKGGEEGELQRGLGREARGERGRETREESMGDRHVGAGRVRSESEEGVGQSGGAEPKVKPNGGRAVGDNSN